MKMVKDPHLKEFHEYFNCVSHKVSAFHAKGVVEIKKVRKYNHKPELDYTFYEIDIIFKGKILAVHSTGEKWFDSEILLHPETSRQKVYSAIRRLTHKTLTEFLALFLGSDEDYRIKKVIWQE
jgi:hypothetical protein